MSFETLQARNARILSRFSAFDLRDQSADDLAAGEEKLFKTKTKIEIIEAGIAGNCIRWFVVESGANLYEVRRFFNFVWCQCRDFFYRRKSCKHIAATRRLSFCRYKLNSELKPGSKPSLRKPEKFGNIKF